jgi:hypothetical protein
MKQKYTVTLFDERLQRVRPVEVEADHAEEAKALAFVDHANRYEQVVQAIPAPTFMEEAHS